MKIKTLLLVSLASIAMGAAALAQPSEEPRPVLDAALKATPSQRLKAGQFLRSAYPKLPEDLMANLKSTYPDLEHGVVDAALETWQQHPGEALRIAQDVKTKFGPRLKVLHTRVAQELETSYPQFRERLARVLSQDGIGVRWQRFMREYHPELLQASRNRIEQTFPEARGWYPGKFLAMKLEAEPGSSPLVEAISRVTESQPDLAPRVAAQIVKLARRQSSSLARDVTDHFLQNRGQLRDALRAEFPGAREKIVVVIESTDPGLVGEVLSFVRQEATPIRKDFRQNLEQKLPGLEQRIKSIVASRYPQIQKQILEKLQG